MSRVEIKAVLAATAATATEVPIFRNGGASGIAQVVAVGDQVMLDSIHVSTTVAGLVHVFHGLDGTNADAWRTLLNGEIVGSRAYSHIARRVLPKGHKIFVIGPGSGTCFVQAWGQLQVG